MSKKGKTIKISEGFERTLAYGLTPDKVANYFLNNGSLERKGATDKSSHLIKLLQQPLQSIEAKGLTLVWFKGETAIQEVQKAEKDERLLTWWPLKNTKHKVMDLYGNMVTMGPAVMSVWKDTPIVKKPMRDSKGRFCKQK